jgi:hypothetical protein
MQKFVPVQPTYLRENTAIKPAQRAAAAAAAAAVSCMCPSMLLTSGSTYNPSQHGQNGLHPR